MTLGERVVAHLRDRGPDYGVAISLALGASSGAVSQALSVLRERGLVQLEREERVGARGHPRRYFRVTPAGQELELRDDEAVDVPRRRVAATPPAPRPLPSPIGDALGDEVALLHAAYGVADADILECVYSNSGVAGL